MRSVRKLLGQVDRGSSLTEVIIGVCVLGVVGMSLLSGINTTQMAQRKTTQVAYAENSLQIGADKLAKIGFAACNSNNPNPYSGQVMPAGESVTAVYVWSNTVSDWVPCSTWLASNPNPQYKQKLTISYSDKAITNRTREVIKLLQDSANKMGTNCSYAVNPISSIGIVAGDTKSTLNPLSTTCATVADTVWETIAANSGITASIDPSTFILTVATSATTPTGSKSFIVGAHDGVTGTTAANTTFSYTVYPTISVASGTTSDWVALEGCGIMPPQAAEDTTLPTKCSVYNAASTGQRSFTLSGGDPSSPPMFQNTPSAAGSPWTVTNTVVSGKNTGVLKYDPTVAGYGAFPVAFTAVGGGLSANLQLPSSLNFKTRQQLTIDPTTMVPAFTNSTLLAIDLTAKSGCTSFKTTSSTCSVAIKSKTGTGYIQRTGANGYSSVDVTFSSGAATAVNVTSNGAFTYSSGNDQYTGTVSIKHNTLISGSLCYGVSSGSTDYKTIGYLNDYVTGQAFAVTVKVKC